MKSEAPKFTRCCFCLPLRRGLIGWAYVKLALNVFAIFITWLLFRNMIKYRPSTELAAVVVICVLTIMIDATFTVLLIFAGHLKSARLLKVSYVYSIVWLVLMLISQVLITFLAWQKTFLYAAYVPFKYLLLEVLTDLATPFVNFLLQVYLILLIRSEMLKLRNQSLEMQFVNNAAEAAAHCVEVNGSDTVNVDANFTGDSMNKDVTDYEGSCELKTDNRLLS